MQRVSFQRVSGHDMQEHRPESIPGPSPKGRRTLESHPGRQQPAAFPRIEVEHKESVGRTDLQAHRFPGAGMDDLPIDGGEDALDDLIVPIQLDVALGR